MNGGVTRRNGNQKHWLIRGVATLVLGSAAITAAPHAASMANGGREVVQPQTGFYCNAKALTPEQRAHHKRLTEKLLASRKATVEMENGYDFQYRAGAVTLSQLADWIGMESKCCPFFDFHIDLEEHGTVLCLRLTGKEGVKRFIRAEFGLDSK